MKTIQPHKQTGSSLVVVMSVLATLMVIVGVAAEYTWTINRHVQRSNTLQGAIAVGDSCIEILFANWRNICNANPTTIQTTSNLAAITLPTASQLNLPTVANFAKRGTSFDPNGDEPADYDASYTISNYKVIAVSPEWTALASSSTAPMPMLGQVVLPTPSPSPATTVVYNYIASADVTLPALGPTGKVVARVRRVFQKQQVSPWNFAIFYLDDLEIHPGPLFTVTGWVHTNADLYTGHNTLTFADKVTYGSDWTIGFNPLDGQHPETPQSPNYPGNLPPARDQELQPFGVDPSLFNTTDNNPNNDGFHELLEQATAGYSDPLASSRYYNQAAVRILINSASNSFTIKKLDGTTVTSSSTGNDKKLYTAVTAALSTTAQSSIQDNREGASVRLTTLDIGSIVTSLNNPSSNANYIAPALWNGIIYITDTSATSSLRRGVRLKNGQVLPASGITVASANPVYIQGDFNTGTGTVPSNAITNNDPTTPQSAGYTRQPSSVVADAVNILSNSWVDANAGTLPKASNTTVNTAVIAGYVPSGGLPVNGVSPQDGSYSGGAENFPRFLEDWSQQGSNPQPSLTYYGSMVELYQSKQSIGEWGKSNVYSPPKRQWYFDNNFKQRPPPGSIMLYSYIKGKWTVF